MTALGPSRLDSLPHGLWSLWEMINANITGLCALCGQLMLQETIRSPLYVSADALDAETDSRQRERAIGWLGIAATIADDFEWSAVHDRIDIFERKIKRSLSNRELATEYRVLRETIEAASKEQLMYRYPNDKAAVLWRWKEEWQDAFCNFPSAQTDIASAVDLWALGHSTASVFQFMRVLGKRRTMPA